MARSKKQIVKLAASTPREVNKRTARLANAMRMWQGIRQIDALHMRFEQLDCLWVLGAAGKRSTRVLINYKTKRVEVKVPDQKFNIIADDLNHLKRILTNINVL